MISLQPGEEVHLGRLPRLKVHLPAGEGRVSERAQRQVGPPIDELGEILNSCSN